jgi:hypothetical protein
MNIDQIKSDFMKQVSEQADKESLMQRVAKMPAMEYLENAFKEPEVGKDGYAKESLPVIWNPCPTYMLDDKCVVDASKLTSASNLYAQYVDEQCIIVDEYQSRLILFNPDPECDAVAFKGGGWSALRVKLEFETEIYLVELYDELQKILK